MAITHVPIQSNVIRFVHIFLSTFLSKRVHCLCSASIIEHDMLDQNSVVDFQDGSSNVSTILPSSPLLYLIYMVPVKYLYSQLNAMEMTFSARFT